MTALQPTKVINDFTILKIEETRHVLGRRSRSRTVLSKS